jgi:TrmH family RNA methyltransferase
MQITSPANQQVKWAHRVREGREPALILVEGERLVEECLAAGLELHASFYLPSSSKRLSALLDQLRRLGGPIYETGQTAFSMITDTITSQGIAVIASRPMRTPEDLFYPRHGHPPLIVGLDQMADPGNLGTIIRTAEGAGASGVVALPGSANAFSPKTLRASMGSAFRLPVVTGLELDQLLAISRSYHLQLIAAAVDGALEYTGFDWRAPALIFFGNEAHGLSQEVHDECTIRVRVPLHPPVESLNVAAAAAAILFEAARQRREVS